MKVTVTVDIRSKPFCYTEVITQTERIAESILYRFYLLCSYYPPTEEHYADPIEAMPVDPSHQYASYYGWKKRSSRENDVVVLAVNPSLKVYAKTITDMIQSLAGKKGQEFLKEFFAEQQSQGARPRDFHYRDPKVFQVALAGESYVEPCIMDFIEKGYLYAIICNEANKIHGSVTIRILHSDQGKICVFVDYGL